jgi:hypothetical protein
MKTAVSVPDAVYRSAEKLAARLGVSRSELYSRALAALVDRYSEELLTEQLNEVYGPDGEDAGLDPALAALQSRSRGCDSC